MSNRGSSGQTSGAWQCQQQGVRTCEKRNSSPFAVAAVQRSWFLRARIQLPRNARIPIVAIVRNPSPIISPVPSRLTRRQDTSLSVCRNIFPLSQPKLLHTSCRIHTLSHGYPSITHLTDFCQSGHSVISLRRADCCEYRDMSSGNSSVMEESQEVKRKRISRVSPSPTPTRGDLLIFCARHVICARRKRSVAMEIFPPVRIV
jgi:hypothetical protein